MRRLRPSGIVQQSPLDPISWARIYNFQFVVAPTGQSEFDRYPYEVGRDAIGSRNLVTALGDQANSTRFGFAFNQVSRRNVQHPRQRNHSIRHWTGPPVLPSPYRRRADANGASQLRLRQSALFAQALKPAAIWNVRSCPASPIPTIGFVEHAAINQASADSTIA